jgi:hypothetical protein
MNIIEKCFFYQSKIDLFEFFSKKLKEKQVFALFQTFETQCMLPQTCEIS